LYRSIRNHGGVPDIDGDAFFLEIGGLINKPVKISLKDLQDPEQFPYVERIANDT
jgi:sulfite oxidase